MVATVAMLMFFPPVVPDCQPFFRKWLFFCEYVWKRFINRAPP